ncbi:hypothetical protein Acr_00g0011940 [Actinidia rufa]|uniref:Uncharacterized protein n=1 Tax=Actinidia rufa TaxID=165716 RepID=A0A7J0D9L2_9ERIC|nr:hypothetical protein Acr_00g0011940 [Actinidia rufa]
MNQAPVLSHQCSAAVWLSECRLGQADLHRVDSPTPVHFLKRNYLQCSHLQSIGHSRLVILGLALHGCAMSIIFKQCLMKSTIYSVLISVACVRPLPAHPSSTKLIFPKQCLLKSCSQHPWHLQYQIGTLGWSRS